MNVKAHAHETQKTVYFVVGITINLGIFNINHSTVEIRAAGITTNAVNRSDIGCPFAGARTKAPRTKALGEKNPKFLILYF